MVVEVSGVQGQAGYEGALFLYADDPLKNIFQVVTNEWWCCSMVSSSLQIGYQQTLVVPMDDWSGLAK